MNRGLVGSDIDIDDDGHISGFGNQGLGNAGQGKGLCRTRASTRTSNMQTNASRDALASGISTQSRQGQGGDRGVCATYK